MKDINGLTVTATEKEEIDAINSASQILFCRLAGIDKLLPSSADQFTACPMLQVYAALMYFGTFSCNTITASFPRFLDRFELMTLNAREALHVEALKALEKINFILAK